MPAPTEEQVKSEIAALKDLAPKIRATTMFGDDNKAAISAQIRVLEEDMDEDDIYNEWEDDDHTIDSAMEARHWMDGEGEGESPAEAWAPLADQ